MLSIGIIGSSGYTGKEIFRICSQHKEIGSISLYANNSAGKFTDDLFPEFENLIPNQKLLSAQEIALTHDVIFSALPHGSSMNVIPSLLEKTGLVIDLSGDFRLNSADDYEKWYNFSHSKEKLLKIKNYALADLPDTKYGSKLISNPGCYPTAVSLALIPFVNEYSDIIESISVSAYSGISGAGSKPSAKLLFGEISGNVYAYKINKHQHEPEIVQTLQKYGMNCNFSFTTHILPVFAGIYSTATIFLKDENKDNFTELYNEYYSNSHFVRIKDEAPQLKHVVDTNFCDININADGSRVIITSAIDNLIKGAAGQAVQNMNRHFGWDEKLGLINF